MVTGRRPHPILFHPSLPLLARLPRRLPDAPDGAVLAACEKLALEQGRALLRCTLAAARQGRVTTAEQKGGPPASAPRRTPDAPRADTPGRS